MYNLSIIILSQSKTRLCLDIVNWYCFLYSVVFCITKLIFLHSLGSEMSLIIMLFRSNYWWKVFLSVYDVSLFISDKCYLGKTKWWKKKLFMKLFNQMTQFLQAWTMRSFVILETGFNYFVLQTASKIIWFKS